MFKIDRQAKTLGDIDFWRSRLGNGSNVREVFDRKRLRFYLFSSEDFRTFDSALDGEVKAKAWGVPDPQSSDDGDPSAEVEPKDAAL